MDYVGQEVTLVIDTWQTDLAQDMSCDSVVSRTKRAKPARRPGPVMEVMQVLFVGDVFFGIRFWHALGLVILPVAAERHQRVHLGMQAAKLRRWYIDRLSLKFAQRAKIDVQVEWVCVHEIRSVQSTVHDGAQLDDEVLTLDVACEAVHVGETEPQSFAEGRQQAIVIKLVHHELRKFQYGTSDSDLFQQHCLCAKVFHLRQILVDHR